MEVIDSNTNDDNTNSNTKISNKKQARYGKNVQWPVRIELFQGKIDLSNPEWTIYLLEGLKYCYNTANTYCYIRSHQWWCRELQAIGYS